MSTSGPIYRMLKVKIQTLILKIGHVSFKTTDKDGPFAMEWAKHWLSV